MSDINQDDIDKLLQDALVGGGSDANAPEDEPAEEDRGAASQDDIDALFAAVGNELDAAEPGAASEETVPDASDDEDDGGVASQDDIDALFSAVGEDDEPAPAPEPPAEGSAPAPTPAPAPDIEGIASNEDIDALFSAMAGEDDISASSSAESDTELLEDTDEPSASDDDSLESQLAATEAALDKEAAEGDSDLDALLSAIAEEPATPDAAPAPNHDGGKDETVRVDVDLDELLRQVSEAAPPPPPRPIPTDEGAPGEDTAVLDMNSPDVAEALARANEPAAPAATPPEPSAPPPPPAETLPPPPAPTQRREFSVLYGAGEVESVSNQISALLSTMSEKAHGYMQAWIAADSEAKELRTRALSEERRRATLESEKAMIVRELDALRSRLGELEGAKVAIEESSRTLETSYEAKTREQESRIKLLSSEAEALKDELTKARNQATGVDIESRRARFEVDRLKNEVESERMERLRIQRALENREKEIQALQSQTSGQASSLFIDELHRLVRRLESELGARTSGAHEALKQLDRLEVVEDMVPVVANIRAALMQAIGADDDQDDALKSLGREASGVQGPAAIAPSKADMASFETALSTYNLGGAIDAAGTLLREARATPAVLMRKIYQCSALRRPDVSPNLDELARLLEGLRTVQEAADRSRGSETAESEVFYVHMFDFLHNLVRLKLLNRLSGDLWRLFLDLRGRFSFVTSDKQWADYRDQILNDKKPKA